MKDSIHQEASTVWGFHASNNPTFEDGISNYIDNFNRFNFKLQNLDKHCLHMYTIRGSSNMLSDYLNSFIIMPT